MKHQENDRAKNPGELLDHAITPMRGEQADNETMRTAGDHVWQRLSQEVAALPQVESIRGCGDVRSLLVQYRAGQLSPARALLVESHLHECVTCRREAETGKRESSSLAPWKQ